MAAVSQEPDPGRGEVEEESPWHSTSQNAVIMAEAASAGTSRILRPTQHIVSFVDASHGGQSYIAVSGHYADNGYQELRPAYAGAYHLGVANQAELFQTAHSTYGNLTSADPAAFVQQHHHHDDSEAMPAYSALVTGSEGQLIAASAVDSSSMQQSYLVLDQDHNMVRVQRVVSPADCTVSQSTVGVGPESREVHPSTTSLLTMPTMSTNNQFLVQVPLASFSAQEEVSTSSMDNDLPMNTLGTAIRRSLMGRTLKIEMEATSAECDTTQEDLDCPPHGQGYLQAVGLGDHSLGMESGGLHSTMMTYSQPITATVTSADMVGGAAIGSGQLHHLHNVHLASSSIASAGHVGSHLGIISCQALPMEEGVVSASGLIESSSLERDRSPGATYKTLTRALTGASVSAAANSDKDENQPSTSGIVMATAPSTEESCSRVDAGQNTVQHWFASHKSPLKLPRKPQPKAKLSQQPLQPQRGQEEEEEGQVQTRKSSRLAQLQQQEESKHLRQTYESRPYSVNEIWCEDCQQSCEDQCSNPAHRLNPVVDKPVLSRAWATCPTTLRILRISKKTVGESEYADVSEMGVYAKKPVSKFTQFGPYIAELVDSPEKVAEKDFLLKVEREEGSFYFNTQDENKCNWMIFVRPATTYAEQNLVAFQYGNDIYFTVIKNIDKDQELMVWYATHYAEHIGARPHELTEMDLALLDEQASRFQCSSCLRRFRTNAALVRHLLEHDDQEEITPEEEREEEERGDREAEATKESEEGPQRGRRRGRAGHKMLHLLKGKSGTLSGENVGSGYQWKRRQYQSGTWKKYARKSSRQAISSLYRRRSSRIGGRQEWICKYCNWIFNNPSVLNLHTLTHAAEDVGLEEILQLAVPATALAPDSAANGHPAENSNAAVGGLRDGEEMMLQMLNGKAASVENCLACPVCRIQFAEKQELIEHVAEHGRAPPPNKPFRCPVCWKGFLVTEKLQRHLLCHGEESSKPLACQMCPKRFMNNSALACHLKIHSENKYYQCSMCHEGFDKISSLKEHVASHADESGSFTCQHCQKTFDDYLAIRKHMRTFHSDRQYSCPECKKDFPRPDKLKLHMLRHTSHREFMCETCGRQFKRKDKLKEHTRRIHQLDRNGQPTIRPGKPGKSKKFTPKVEPTDYQRFIYKCHQCMLGFKRRGMLVNHISKRHPGVKPESVHELNLPILRQQRDYYCHLCDKVYKSSSKRKTHILKSHPGAPLPPSVRHKLTIENEDMAVLNSETYSQKTQAISTTPHRCQLDNCHKQYASKAKLLQHQRKMHPGQVPPLQERRKKGAQEQKTDMIIDAVVDDGSVVEQYVDSDVIVAAPNAGDMAGADVLTQAMTEIFSGSDFRGGGSITVHPDTIQLSRLLSSGGTVIQVQGASLQPTTIELSTLQQALNTQFTTHTQLTPCTTLIAASPGVSNAQMPVISAQPIISMVTNNGQTIPVSIQGNQAFMSRPWVATNFQTFHQQR